MGFHFKEQVKKLVHGHPYILSCLTSAWEKARGFSYVLFYYNRKPLEEKTIFFESFIGRKYADSPRAMYEAMLKDSSYASYKKVWSFQNPEDYAYLKEQPNTELVAYRSREYYRVLSTAKYWVTNYHIQEGVKKHPRQVYVQTWHGTPLKKIGCDVEHTSLVKREQKRMNHFYEKEGHRFTYVVSPSPFYTEKFTSAFRLGNQAKILEYGYPRNDLLFQSNEEKTEMLKRKLHIPQGKKVILYCPTWRDNQNETGAGFTYKMEIDYDQLKKELSDDYVMLLRLHYLIRDQIPLEKGEQFFYDVTDYDEVGELYLITDLLVTDYSSVFFDYANLRKPMLFYMYDYEEYKNHLRDFYFDMEELPGIIIKEKTDQLPARIRQAAEEFQYDEKYEKFNEKFNPHRAPCASRVNRAVFRRRKQR